MTLYVAFNGAAPTTAAFVPVTTGTAIKTLLQVATPSTRGLKVVEWGISFNGSAAGTPIICELLETDVAATVTAHVAAGVAPYNDDNAPASLMTLSTTGTGYTASVEGAITSTRLIDVQHVPPSSGYSKQFPLGREPHLGISDFLRIRVDAVAAVDAICYIVWEE